VLRGREDWLFWTGEGNIDDYQNAHPFSRADLEQIEGKLSAVQRRLAAQGIAFLVAPAPNKETIYPEMLPPEIVKIGKQSRLDQLLAYLEEKHSAVKVLDLRPVLLDNKAQHQLYYRTDTHWNDYGAYYAARNILKRQRIPHCSAGWRPTDIAGDTAATGAAAWTDRALRPTLN